MMAIGDEAGKQIEREVGRAAVPGVFNVQQVFELVKHRFHDRPPTKQPFLVQEHKPVQHVPLHVGDQPEPAAK